MSIPSIARGKKRKGRKNRNFANPTAAEKRSTPLCGRKRKRGKKGFYAPSESGRGRKGERKNRLAKLHTKCNCTKVATGSLVLREGEGEGKFGRLTSLLQERGKRDQCPDIIVRPR